MLPPEHLPLSLFCIVLVWLCVPTAALAMAEAHPNFVAGLVCRHQPASLPPSLVLMVPGVRLTEGTDSLGQQYLTPEKVG